MGFGFVEALGMVGNLARVISQPPTAAPPVQPQKASIDQEDFIKMFKLAMQEHKKEEETETVSTKTEKSDDTLDLNNLTLKNLFSFLDVNKDGVLTNDEFKKLKDVVATAKR